MEKSNLISVPELREVLSKILAFIETDLGVSEIPLKQDFYWTIEDSERYSLGAQPTKFECGSLIDDLEFIREAYINREQAIPLLLLHVAPILEALATAVPSFIDDANSDSQ